MSGPLRPAVPPVSSPRDTLPDPWYLSYEIPNPNPIAGRAPTREEIEIRIHPGASNFQLANMRSTLYQPPPPRTPTVEETPGLPPLNFPRRTLLEPRNTLNPTRDSNENNNSSRLDRTRRPPPLRGITMYGNAPIDQPRAAGSSSQWPPRSEEIEQAAERSFLDHLLGRNRAAAGEENSRNMGYPGLESYAGLPIAEESFIRSSSFERPPIMQQRRSQGLEFDDYLGLGRGPGVNHRGNWSGYNIPPPQPASDEQTAGEEDEYANYIYPLIDGILVGFELDNVLTSLQLATILADPDLENRSVAADLVHPFTAGQVPHIHAYRYRVLADGSLGLRLPAAISDRISRSRVTAEVRDQGGKLHPPLFCVTIMVKHPLSRTVLTVGDILAPMNPRYLLYQPQELIASQETETVSGSDFYQSDYAITIDKLDSRLRRNAIGAFESGYVEVGPAARDFSNSAKSLKFSFLFSFSIEGICKSDFLCYMSNFKARQPQGSDDL
ncbi:hypothetical protein BKA61DRAFT_660049 [Leptodontidium sp. MPI-SDFR-AT-0119]|nr:hypothetical protein BKA61DRAFT_660049 [Leptodontidium sp. MPI-SDFR-AT-0119]